MTWIQALVGMAIAAVSGGAGAWAALKRLRMDAARAEVDLVEQWREEYRAAVADLRAELDRVKAENASLREAVSGLQVTDASRERRLARMQQTEGHLIQWIALLHTGIQNGAIPPMPAVPACIQTLIEKESDPS